MKKEKQSNYNSTPISEEFLEDIGKIADKFFKKNQKEIKFSIGNPSISSSEESAYMMGFLHASVHCRDIMKSLVLAIQKEQNKKIKL
jgi:hypothetical protein